MATNKNIARLKKVQADAKKLKAKNPKLSHIEAVKKAWAMQPKTKASATKKRTTKKKVGATKFVEAKETTKTKPARIIKVTRKKNGTFKKFETIGSVGLDIFTRIINDVNGNPRYVFHYPNILNKEEINFLPFNKQYEYALKKAKLIGGRKFHNKQYGGGIVIQSYNLNDTIKKLIDLKNSTPKIKI